MNFDEILHDCLVSLEAGGTIEECLTSYPEQAAALQPLLETMVAVRTAPLQELSEDAFARGQATLWAAAQQNRRAQRQHGLASLAFLVRFRLGLNPIQLRLTQPQFNCL